MVATFRFRSLSLVARNVTWNVLLDSELQKGRLLRREILSKHMIGRVFGGFLWQQCWDKIHHFVRNCSDDGILLTCGCKITTWVYL